jgi:hypothetical protein
MDTVMLSCAAGVLLPLTQAGRLCDPKWRKCGTEGKVNKNERSTKTGKEKVSKKYNPFDSGLLSYREGPGQTGGGSAEKTNLHKKIDTRGHREEGALTPFFLFAEIVKI